MIGWVHFYTSTKIHPVLCWYSYDRRSAQSVATMTGFRWNREQAVPLDTEAEVAALLLQGFTMYAPVPNEARVTVTCIRMDHG